MAPALGAAVAAVLATGALAFVPPSSFVGIFPTVRSETFMLRAHGMAMSEHVDDRRPSPPAGSRDSDVLVLEGPMELIRIGGSRSQAARGRGQGGGRGYNDFGGGRGNGNDFGSGRGNAFGAGRGRGRPGSEFGGGQGNAFSGGRGNSFGMGRENGYASGRGGGGNGRGGGGGGGGSGWAGSDGPDSAVADVVVDDAPEVLGGKDTRRRPAFGQDKKKFTRSVYEDGKKGRARNLDGGRKGRRGADDVVEDDDEDAVPLDFDPLAVLSDQLRYKAAATPGRGRGGRGRGRGRRGRGSQGPAPVREMERPIEITEATITVADLAERMKVKGAEVIKYLMMDMGIMATVTQSIDADTAASVVEALGKQVTRFPLEDEEAGESAAERVADTGAAIDADDPESLVKRPPVVTIMGHVDHGKTTLLDAIRKARVADGEAGGITQHVGAYQVRTESGQDVTFIDTPGHAAFSEMRARGANATDVVVLVVAADDGVKDQTKECIATAKLADVPIVVAVNKVDKPEADVAKVQNELMRYDLLPEEYGGDVQVAQVSAKQGEGLDDLLEKILLQAEVLDLKANPKRSAQGVVIEAKLEKGLGTVSTTLIQRGTVRVGDIFVAGESWGKVRALMDENGERLTEAGPSVPVQIVGFDGVPAAGDMFVVAEKEETARDLAAARRQISRQAAATAMQGGLKVSMEAILSGEAFSDGKEKLYLPVVIKADVQGSEQALATALGEMVSENEYFRATAKLLHTGVGEITKSDIAIAGVSGAYIIGFNVGANFQAVEEARQEGIKIGYYTVVYDVMDNIQKSLDELSNPTPEGVYVGKAHVKMIFSIGKVGNVAGCGVDDGIMKKGANVRVMRLGRVVHEGTLRTLKNVKQDVNEMVAGTECGIQVQGFEDYEEDDIIECYTPE